MGGSVYNSKADKSLGCSNLALYRQSSTTFTTRFKFVTIFDISQNVTNLKRGENWSITGRDVLYGGGYGYVSNFDTMGYNESKTVVLTRKPDVVLAVTMSESRLDAKGR